MSDVNQKMLEALLDSNKALIVSNESISASVRVNSDAVKATNETVKELTVSVRELVTTERERVLKDEHQKEINAKQEIYNAGNTAQWKEHHDTIVRAKGLFVKIDKAWMVGVGLFVVGIFTLLGFKFK